MHQLQQAPATARRDRRVAGRRPSAALARVHATRPPRATPDDGLSRLLRSAVARRTGPGLLQRYELLTSGGLAADPGEYSVNTLNDEFEAQVVDLAGQTISAPTPAIAPTVRVSDDGNMAIEDTNLTARQAKVFYATSAVWQASNPTLANVNSKYELYSDRTNAIDVHLADGTQKTLDRVLPRTRVAPATGRVASQQGLTMDIEADCIMVAQAVMHHANGYRKPGLPFTPAVPTDWGEFRTARAMVKWSEAHDYLATKSGWGLSLAKTVYGDENAQAKKAFETQLSKGPTPDAELLAAIAAAYLDLMTNQPAKAAQAAQALGLNTHALANVGEAYETYRVSSDQTPTRHDVHGRSVRDFWAQHIGAVVAASGGDRVTLENYARTTEIGALAAGPHYYFQMYGSKPAQSWHEAWTTGPGGAAAGPPVGLPAALGKDAMTAVVKSG